jgi:hypothetical protein
MKKAQVTCAFDLDKKQLSYWKSNFGFRFYGWIWRWIFEVVYIANACELIAVFFCPFRHRIVGEFYRIIRS